MGWKGKLVYKGTSTGLREECHGKYNSQTWTDDPINVYSITCHLNDSAANLLFQSWKPEGQQDQELIERSKFRLDTMYNFMEKNFSTKNLILKVFKRLFKK